MRIPLICMAIISAVAVGFGLLVKFDPVAYENWSQPEIVHLLTEPEENLIALDKQQLIEITRTSLSALSSFQENSNIRIDELNASLMLLVIALLFNLALAIYLLTRGSGNQPKGKQQD